MRHTVFTEAGFILEAHSFARGFSEPVSPPPSPPWEDSLATGKLSVNGRCVWGTGNYTGTLEINHEPTVDMTANLELILILEPGRRSSATLYKLQRKEKEIDFKNNILIIPRC